MYNRMIQPPTEPEIFYRHWMEVNSPIKNGVTRLKIPPKTTIGARMIVLGRVIDTHRRSVCINRQVHSFDQCRVVGDEIVLAWTDNDSAITIEDELNECKNLELAAIRQHFGF